MQNSDSLLSRINSPADLKILKPGDLDRLALEIRGIIVDRVSRNGGHLSSNLGTVELSIALHRVFNSPEDQIVWDVGHQSYAHKLLTGRYAEFSGLRKRGGLSGFPKREESPHDAFNTGHSSTSISAAAGILVAKRLKGGKGRTIAVIGDGALTGGLSYEALSHAGHLELPLIVILNDNNMSISPNVGALSKYLSRLSMKAKYQSFRRNFDAMAKKLPFIGDIFYNVVVRLKRAVKAVFYIDNFFVDLGFEYVGPINGHNIRLLEMVFRDVRQLERPVVVHIVTSKGKGYAFAEDDPGGYHGVGAFSVSGGIPEASVKPISLTFTDSFAAALLAAAKREKRVVALTAAMEQGTGLSLFKKTCAGRFFDVGIAESHAVTFAAGLAAQGLKPVVAIYSTFIQRSIDQVIHDVSLQVLPIVFALDRAGFVGGDGETHQGLFDICLFRVIPNMVILAPASDKELGLMLDYVLSLDVPSMIRYPKAPCPAESPEFSHPIEKGRGVWISRNKDSRICLAFTGSLYPQALGALRLLKDKGIEADAYNLRFLNQVDEEYLVEVLNSYDLMAFAEEGVKQGGFGEYACALAQQRSVKARTLILAADADFAANGRALGTREELLKENGLDSESLANHLAKAQRR
jgi:1-deoxy-D-xylulose-5-phosphate synthase